MTPANSQVHYETSFRVTSSHRTPAEIAEILRKIIRSWIQQKEGTNEKLMGKWFHSGGGWSLPNRPHTIVSTLAFEEGGWSLFYQESDKTLIGKRFWYTDLGLRILERSVVVSIKISHAMNREFVGITPPSPEPSAPKIIRNIFDAHDFQILSGNLYLYPTPRQIRFGEVNILDDAIFTVQRYIPLIFVNGSFNHEHFPINVDSIQKNLIGKAQVFWCNDEPELGEELGGVLPRNYQCRYRSIRVYLPNADNSRSKDHFRHRFFSMAEIAERGAAAITDAITSTLARGYSNRDPEGFLTHSEIQSFMRSKTLMKFRLEDKPTKEWISTLEAELSATTAKMASDKEDYMALLIQAESERDESNREKDKLLQTLRNNEAQINSLTSMRINNGESASENLLSYRKVTGKDTNKATPTDCLRALHFIYNDRIKILPSAFASANDSFGFKHTENLWELLDLLMSDYYSLMKEGGSGDEKARSVFGASYSAKESESVESSPRLKRRRTFSDQGTDKYMPRHLKIGVKDSVAETIRVHFDWDASLNKILIGHCGPHLPLS